MTYKYVTNGRVLMARPLSKRYSIVFSARVFYKRSVESLFLVCLLQIGDDDLVHLEHGIDDSL